MGVKAIILSSFRDKITCEEIGRITFLFLPFVYRGACVDEGVFRDGLIK